MPEQLPLQPGSVLEIRPSFIPLAFLLYACKPYYSINGSPAVAGQWKQNVVPIPPGTYQLTIWVKYFISPQMGLATIVVDIPPGATVVVTWRAPLTIFGTGRIANAGVGPSAPIGAGPAAYANGGPPSLRPGSVEPRLSIGSSPQVGPLPNAAGGWHPDPTGRHQARYFDGSRWTEHVSDGTLQARDPIT